MPLPVDGKPLCICQICECGRHRCPHSPAKPKYDKECLISEYKNVFVGKSAERTQPIKPQCLMNQNTSPFAKDTTTNLAYVSHPVHAPFQRKKQVWVPSTVPLESATTARDHYIKHCVSPSKSKKPESSINRNPGKMSELTSHRFDYTHKQVEKVQPALDYSSLTCAPGPFDGDTTMRSDYIKYITRPRTSFTPHREYKQPTVAMDGQTSNKTDYTAWDLPKKHVTKSLQFVPTSGRTGTTTFQTDFTAKTQRRPSPCLPQTASGDRGEFYDSTTFRDTYKAWPVCPPVQRERLAHNPPEVPLESSTCYREDFIKKSARPASCKPRVDYRKPTGSMATSTTHRDTFKGWSNVKPVSPAQDYHVRSTPPPFEGLSTYKDHFYQCSGAPATSLAPPNVYTKSEKPLDGSTTYSRDYPVKDMTVCPVPALPKTPTLIKSGHKFYSSAVKDRVRASVLPTTAITV